MKSKILIAGVARNSGKKLIKLHRIFEKAFEDFDTEYFIVESDSSDDTIKTLERLASNSSKFEFISLGNLSNQIELKSERVAKCRNAYIHYFQNKMETSNYLYLVVVDWDRVNYGLKKRSVDSCWEKTDWDICTANQRGPYYDLWALRCVNWLDWDCHIKFRNDYQYGFRRAYFRNFVKPMFKARSSGNWISTTSSFGGLGIYRSKVIGNEVYEINAEVGCEHVLFHSALTRKGYRCFINTSLVNSSLTTNAKRTIFNFMLVVILGKIFLQLKRRTSSYKQLFQ